MSFNVLHSGTPAAGKLHFSDVEDVPRVNESFNEREREIFEDNDVDLSKFGLKVLGLS